MNLAERKYFVNITEKFSGFDRTVLLNIYQPIIGSSAASLYLTLLEEETFKIKMNGAIFTIDRLINLTSSTEKQLEKNLKKLEAVKLVKTLISRKTGNCSFNLITPLSPKEFFANEVFNSTLLKKLGEESYEATKFIFKERIIKNNDEEFFEVTANFNEIFDTEMTPENTTFVIINRNDKKLCDKLLDFNLISEMLIKEGIIINFENEDLRNYFSNLLAIHWFKDEEIAEMIYLNYNFVKKEINMVLFEKEVLTRIADSKKDKKIQLSETEIKKASEMNFYDWESYFEMLTSERPTSIMKSSINKLVDAYNLSKGTINCLMEFSVFKNKGSVIFNYISKVAKTINETGLTNTEEVMLYLKSVNKLKKKDKIIKTNLNSPETDKASTEFERFNIDKYQNDISDEEILTVMNNL